MNLVVPPEADGQRADVVLAGLLGQSRSQVAARLDAGQVTTAAVERGSEPVAVEPKVVGRSDRLVAGQVLEVAEPPAPPSAPAPPVPPIRWQDDHLLVLAKPAGLVVHPGAGHPDGTLVDALRAAGVPLAPRAGQDRPGVVHRLDKDTSGLLVVACTDAAHAGLVEALRRREVTRAYLALVEGTLPSATGRVEAPIGRDPHQRQRFAVVEDGKAAITHWQVRASGRGDQAPVTLVGCRLETGRTHQIRVHMAFAGTPVVGDRRYGAATALADRLGIDRPCLHAATLGFTHPITGESVEVSEPLPADLQEAARLAGVAAEHLAP